MEAFKKLTQFVMKIIQFTKFVAETSSQRRCTISHKIFTSKLWQIIFTM
jgi:hypothetical protein